jgi:hypothetical protein
MGRKEVWRKVKNEEFHGMKFSKRSLDVGGMKGGKFLSIIFST